MQFSTETLKANSVASPRVRKSQSSSRFSFVSVSSSSGSSGRNRRSISLLGRGGTGNGNSKRLVHLFKERGEHVALSEVIFAEERGGDMNEKADYGMTLLMIAVGNNCSNEVVEYLIQRGARVDDKNIIGQTALFTAVTTCVRLTKLLLEYGADANVRDVLTARSPLMEAAGFAPDLEIVTWLCCAGASLDARDSKKRLPVDFAKQKSRESEFLAATHVPNEMKLEQKERLDFDVNDEPASPQERKNPDHEESPSLFSSLQTYLPKFG